jgi:excisionase family DNA binding protein
MAAAFTPALAGEGPLTLTAHAFGRTTVATTGTLPQLLTIDQLVERLGVSGRHVRRLVAEKRVPYLKIGKFVRFDSAEIATWLDRARVGRQDSDLGRLRADRAGRPCSVQRVDPPESVGDNDRLLGRRV